MEIDVLVDTSLFIRQAPGTSRLTLAMNAYKFRVGAVSTVTKFEYELGELRANRSQLFETQFSQYIVVSLDSSIWKRALFVQNFSIGMNARMELADLLIASTAIFLKIPLLTLNFDHFFHLQTHEFGLRLPKIP
jgi:predicted nucleic acid-binding protein